MPILKSGGQDVRICGDYKLTINQVSALDRYPVPRVEDLLSSLAGGKAFTKLDLSNAYQQMELDDEAKQYTTINTHKGLFQYNRVPYGIKSAPIIFQRQMEILLKDIPHTVIFLDNILVTGIDEEEHRANLNEVLKRLQSHGLREKFKKCVFGGKRGGLSWK